MDQLTEIKRMLQDRVDKDKERDDKLDDIHFAIFGSERAGVDGIAKQVKKHGAYIAKDRKLKWILGGSLMVSGGGLWELIKSKMGL